MLILFLLTSIVITGIKRPSLIPIIVFCQASAIAIVCYRSGMAIPPVACAFAVKAVIIPLLLYSIVRKTIAFDQDGSIVPVSAVITLVLAFSVTAYFFARQLNAGSFTMAAIFTALIGVLLITSRKTLVGQLTGFIVLQNGIFAFTSSLCLTFTFAIELVLAMDVLLSVAIMVCAIWMIYKNSGSIDVKTFSALKG
jgi:hydrogenase-4 component E